MCVNEESFPFDASESPRHLHIEAELESNLGLACARQATDFDNLAQAEDHIQEVILRVVSLHRSHIGKLSHQADILSLTARITSDCGASRACHERSR